jgi:hypothetical protein
MTALIRQVDRCQHLLADHLAAAIQVFGSGALGIVDLPSLAAPGRVAPAQLRAAATLYWCMCVEDAGLPGFVDELADAVWDGRVNLPIGDAGSRIAEYRRQREDRRFTRDERSAIYDHLFGDATDFPAQWQAMVDGLCDLATMAADLGTGAVTSRIAIAMQALAQGLSDRAVGIVAFAAREIVAHVRAALALLNDPELARALGGGGVWQIIRLHAPVVLGHALDPGPAIDRAQAGMTILEWVAGKASAIEAGSVAVGRGDPVVRAAITWRAAGMRS